METIYYDGQELKERLEELLVEAGLEKRKLESIEFRATVPYTDFETFKNKYRLLYSREFEELEILANTHIIINMLSSDDQIHLNGNLDKLFYNYTNLETIELSNFDTSNVTSMNYMFDGCENLKTLDLSNFDTHSVISMNWIFSCCYRLENLDLSNFNVHKVKSMTEIFYGCRNLSTLKTKDSKILKAYNKIFKEYIKVLKAYNNIKRGN